MVLIVMLEYKGYYVVFSKGKVFLRHITTRQVKQIGSPVKNLYALESRSPQVERGEMWSDSPKKARIDLATRAPTRSRKTS